MPKLKHGELSKFKDFIEQYAPGHYAEEIAAEVKKRYGLEVTDNQVRIFLSNRGIKNGMQGKLRRDYAPQTMIPTEMANYIKDHQYDFDNDKMYEMIQKEFPSCVVTRAALIRFRRKYRCTYRILTDGMLEFCKQNKTIPRKELCALLKDKFGKEISRERLNALLSHYGITYDNRKNNSKRLTKHEVGDLRERRGHKGDSIYTEIMVSKCPNIWMPYQRYVYEQHHKVKLGKDMNVIFIDGNKKNFEINNLFAIPVKYMAIMANRGIWTSIRNQENLDVGLTLAKINMKLTELKKKRKELKKK